MGNSNAVSIHVDQPIYYSGGNLSGTVDLNLVETFEIHSDAKGLDVIVSGVEETAWTTGSGKHRRHHHGKASVLNLPFTIYQWPTKTIPKGQYSFPFSCPIPPNLPPSFSYHNFVRASIIYKATALLRKSGFFSSNLEQSCVFYLYPTPQIPQALQPVETTRKIAVMTCCCCNKGDVTSRVIIDKNAYGLGESASISVDCNNDSTEEIRKINVILQQKVVCRAGASATTRSKNCSKVQIQRLAPNSHKQVTVQLPITNVDYVMFTSPLIDVVYNIFIEHDIPMAPDLEINYAPIIYAAAYQPSVVNGQQNFAVPMPIASPEAMANLQNQMQIQQQQQQDPSAPPEYVMEIPQGETDGPSTADASLPTYEVRPQYVPGYNPQVMPAYNYALPSNY